VHADEKLTAFIELESATCMASGHSHAGTKVVFVSTSPVLIRQKCLEGEDPQPDKELSPDSQESQEAVVVDERRLDNAAWVWGKLNPEERQSLLKATEAI
jgi:hypothetical protein